MKALSAFIVCACVNWMLPDVTERTRNDGERSWAYFRLDVEAGQYCQAGGNTSEESCNVSRQETSKAHSPLLLYYNTKHFLCKSLSTLRRMTVMARW